MSKYRKKSPIGYSTEKNIKKGCASYRTNESEKRRNGDDV